MKTPSNLVKEERSGNPSNSRKKDETRRYSSSREAIYNKYAAIREKSGQASKLKSEDNNISSAMVPLLDDGGDAHSGTTSGVVSSGLASKWHTMKTSFQSFKADVGTKRFSPTRQMQEDKISHVSSSESLDDNKSAFRPR